MVIVVLIYTTTWLCEAEIGQDELFNIHNERESTITIK